jgi:hypothetical protein
MACHHVFALHAKEKWQGAQLLESGRKPPSHWRSGGPAATDGRTSRYTQPEADLQLLPKQLKLELPGALPPKITASHRLAKKGSVVKTF